MIPSSSASPMARGMSIQLNQTRKVGFSLFSGLIMSGTVMFLVGMLQETIK